MRLIECRCGIRHQIYDWPSETITEKGKEMVERHISCSCKREIVVRTSPKEEPGFEPVTEKDIAKSGKPFSFAEISKQMGVLKEKDKVDTAPVKTDYEGGKKSISLADHDAELFYQCVYHYGTKFKSDNPQERMKFYAFAERGKTGSVVVFESETEERMARMAFTERNLYVMFPIIEDLPLAEVHKNEESAAGKKAAEALRDRILKVLEE